MGSCCVEPVEDLNTAASRVKSKLAKEPVTPLSTAKSVAVIFLDVDGVLNNVSCHMAGVNEKCVAALTHCFESYAETRCDLPLKLVLSTTWRNCEKSKADLLTELKRLTGFDVSDQMYIGDTPLCDGLERGYEIREFIYTCTEWRIEQWVAIDDRILATDQFKEFFDGHFVRTKITTGLTTEDAAEVVQLLK